MILASCFVPGLRGVAAGLVVLGASLAAACGGRTESFPYEPSPGATSSASEPGGSTPPGATTAPIPTPTPSADPDDCRLEPSEQSGWKGHGVCMLAAGKTCNGERRAVECRCDTTDYDEPGACECRVGGEIVKTFASKTCRSACGELRPVPSSADLAACGLAR